MLQYVSRDATLFVQSFMKRTVSFSETCEVAQLFSTVGGTELVIIQDGEYNVGRDMSSGMCNQRVPFSPKVCQCNAQSVCRKKGRKKKVSQAVVKNVVRVPRGCFGNNVRSRPCDFLIHD